MKRILDQHANIQYAHLPEPCTASTHTNSLHQMEYKLMAWKLQRDESLLESIKKVQVLLNEDLDDKIDTYAWCCPDRGDDSWVPNGLKNMVDKQFYMLDRADHLVEGRIINHKEEIASIKTRLRKSEERLKKHGIQSGKEADREVEAGQSVALGEQHGVELDGLGTSFPGYLVEAEAEEEEAGEVGEKESRIVKTLPSAPRIWVMQDSA